MFAHTDEIVELAKVANEYGGRYATHVRGHSGTYDLAVREALEIASRSGCRLQLSHVFAVPYLGHLADILYSMMGALEAVNRVAVSYTHLRAHETRHDLVCRLLLEKKK